jgi:hypothetical protein
VIPPDASAAFVANMEDVLEVYQRPHDPQRPLVCLDETSKQLIIETRAPISAKPGRKARHDSEYERNGVANLFMVFAPLEGAGDPVNPDLSIAWKYLWTAKDTWLGTEQNLGAIGSTASRILAGACPYTSSRMSSPCATKITISGVYRRAQGATSGVSGGARRPRKALRRRDRHSP